MMQRFRITFQPRGKEVMVPEGATIRDAIELGDIDFHFPCGGRGKCGKCRVRITGEVPPPTRAEQEHLDEEELKSGIRLACVTLVDRELTVELPEETATPHKILVSGAERGVRVDPHLRKTRVAVAKPQLSDQRGDWDRIQDALKELDPSLDDLEVPLRLLRGLPQLLRKDDFQITAVTEGDQVVGLERGTAGGELLGIAFDIGTTTIVGYLMDLINGEELAVASCLNPQGRYGADVISRITYTTQEADGLETMQREVVGALNTLIAEAVNRAGVEREMIYAATMVGNTCMHHLFLGIDPRQIAVSPYVAGVTRSLTIAAEEIGLKINRAGRIYVLPDIAGFVGADTVGVLLATELDQSEGVKLALDIGTNGEIVLGSRERLVACSAAAGPAFEGAHISSGMRGADGAIDHVRFGDEVTYSVIGGKQPKGICGSGLLDAVAGMLVSGVVNPMGKILPPEKLAGTPAARFADRIVEHDKQRAFLLVDGSKTEHGRPILITQKDIRELQLAKGAMSTGVRVLMEVLGVGVEEISEVLLAGAFGNYLDPHSACTIGLIPPELEQRVRMVGNAAGTGAKIALLSRSEYRRAGHIADFTDYIELGCHPHFSDLFSESMLFPAR